MLPFEKIAKILRAKPESIRLLEEKLGVLTGKKGVMTQIVEENETEIQKRLDFLGLDQNVTAKEIYDGLISKIEADDAQLFKVLGSPSALIPQDWERVLEVARYIAGQPKGFFLKKEKAIEMLKNEPPLKILDALNYKNIEDMLEKENIFEIFSALRFVEGSEWLNEIFFKQYKNLKPEDFEKREIKVLALPERWTKIAQSFVKHKYHNISHLKELGLIYVIPLSLEISGEVIRNFGLILHYFNEIEFYSCLFEKYAEERGLMRKLEADQRGNNFAQNLISLLRGDTINKLPENHSSKFKWLIIQRYLAKDDEKDWRLFEPHINPEAVHWEKAERMLVRAGKTLDNFSTDLSFWENLNWVGDYFSSYGGSAVGRENGNNGEILVSFNLVDMAMALVKERQFIKYLYHHQESLWNKIFTEYFGQEKMEEMIKENIIKGWFEI